MSIKNITVKNSSNNDITYVAMQPQSGAVPALWVARAGARVAQSNIRLDVRPRVKKSPVDRITFSHVIPILDETTGTVRTYTANLQILAPVAGTDAEMVDFIIQLTGIIGNTDIQGYLKNVSPPV